MSVLPRLASLCANSTSCYVGFGGPRIASVKRMPAVLRVVITLLGFSAEVLPLCAATDINESAVANEQAGHRNLLKITSLPKAETRPQTPRAAPAPLRGRVGRRESPSESDWGKIEVQARQLTDVDPKDPRFAALKKAELMAALRGGSKGKALPAEKRAKIDAYLADKTRPAQDRYELRALLQLHELQTVSDKKNAGVDKQRLRATRELIAEFPEDKRGYAQLLGFAKGRESGDAVVLAKELISSSAPDEVKKESRMLLEQRALEGKKLNVPGLELARYRGKPVVLYFWSIKQPEIFDSIRYWAKADVQFVGINTDDDSATARKLVSVVATPGAQIYDGSGLDGVVAKALKPVFMGAIYLIDAKGVLRDVSGHLETSAKIERLVREGRGAK